MQTFGMYGVKRNERSLIGRKLIVDFHLIFEENSLTSIQEKLHKFFLFKFLLF